MIYFPKLYVYSCENSLVNGEGQLYFYINKLLSKKFFIVEYSDFYIDFLRSKKFTKDRVLPIYLFIVILIHKFFLKRKILLVNYVPLWNFLNSILVRFNINISIVNGSIGILPKKYNKIDYLNRIIIQNIFCKIFIFFYPKNKIIFCSTPSSFKFLCNHLNAKLILPFFLMPTTYEESPIKDYHIFIYSNNHIIKNHDILLKHLPLLESKYKIFKVGLFDTHFNYSSFDFDNNLMKSKIFLTLSYEDAGITAMKAAYNNIPVICPKISGCAYLLDYDEFYCINNIDDISEIINKINLILNNYDYHVDRINKYISSKIPIFQNNVNEFLNEIK